MQISSTMHHYTKVEITTINFVHMEFKKEWNLRAISLHVWEGRVGLIENHSLYFFWSISLFLSTTPYTKCISTISAYVKRCAAFEICSGKQRTTIWIFSLSVLNSTLFLLNKSFNYPHFLLQICLIRPPLLVLFLTDIFETLYTRLDNLKNAKKYRYNVRMLKKFRQHPFKREILLVKTLVSLDIRQMCHCCI